MFKLASTIWKRTPVDGSGFIQLGPKSIRRLTRIAKKTRWKSLPIWSRPFAIICARLLLLTIPIHVLICIHRHATQIPWKIAFYTIWLGWTRGKSPTLFLSTYSSVELNVLKDNLDDSQASLLLSALGDKEDRSRCGDKIEATKMIASIGLAVAPILTELNANTTHIDFSCSPWSEHDKLFVKPRHGFAARYAMSVQKIDKHHFKIRGQVISCSYFTSWLMSYIAKNPMIVQPFLRPASSTLDISQKTATWLRIFVYRSPKQSAQLLSIALKILPPDKDVESNIDNILMAPINPNNATLLDAILPGRPSERFSSIPWNGVKLKGRYISECEEAIKMVLKASELFPDVPFIGWDVMLTDQGPVILEPNTGISLNKAQLWYFETDTPSPVTDTLLEWADFKGV